MNLRLSSIWKRVFVCALVWVAGIYVLSFTILLALENPLLFRPVPASVGWKDAPSGLQLCDVVLYAGGVKLHASWCIPPNWQPAHGAVLYCHGNAGNLSSRWAALLSWQALRGEAILIFDYPGFGKSEGKPSEAGCYAAVHAAAAWLTEVQGMDPGRVILVGESLGAAVAAHLATNNQHQALVLLSPFTSVSDLAAMEFPAYPSRLFLHNRFDNTEYVRQIQIPLLI